MTTFARTWLASSARVRVLHVFEPACNLVNENDEILSLVCPAIGNGPFNLVVPPVRFSDYVTPSSPVSLQLEQLIVGNLVIHINAADLWDPYPTWQHLSDSEHIKHHILVLLAVLGELAPPGSLAGLVVALPPPASPLEARILDTARQPAHALVQGIVSTDADLCSLSASELAGLGSGLTPSGDDWILGCLLAGWATRTQDNILQSIVDAVTGRTIPLSLSWLNAAARGECGAAWHMLANALSNSESYVVEKAARTLVQTGHTSGADALAGFVSVLMTCTTYHRLEI